MEKEKMEIEKMLEEIKEMLQKNVQERIKAKVNVIVKGNNSEVEIPENISEILIAIINIIQVANKKMIEKGIAKEETKKLLKVAFEIGMEA